LISAKYNKTPAQRLIRWNLQLGTVPLPKTNQRKHVEDDLDVVDFEISDDELATLSSLKSAIRHSARFLTRKRFPTWTCSTSSNDKRTDTELLIGFQPGYGSGIGSCNLSSC
jgi:hypothetical protein